MCFVWIWEQTAIISLYSINWLVCITETQSVYCAVRAGSLNAVWIWRSRQQRTPKKPESLFTLQLKREEQEFFNSSLSARNKQMFTKGFLFVLKGSQSSMKILKGFSCSKIVMFTVEDSSKFLTRHGSVIALPLLSSSQPHCHIL